tara:strand:- start:722 stop:886 length:165 start_codon:yes stop_codon:yes gene_type:complete
MKQYNTRKVANNKIEIVKLRMTSQDKKQLQKSAKQEGKSVSGFIRDLIKEYENK